MIFRSGAGLNMGAGIGQRFDDLVEFVEGAGPPVSEHERQRIRSLPGGVYVVQPEAVDLAQEMVLPVECGFLPPPVEAISPVGAQLLQ